MKKLMFAATVAAAMAGFAVESQVVGYQNKLANSQGSVWTAATFAPVDGHTMKLGDLRFVTSSEDAIVYSTDATLFLINPNQANLKLTADDVGDRNPDLIGRDATFSYLSQAEIDENIEACEGDGDQEGAAEWRALTPRWLEFGKAAEEGDYSDSFNDFEIPYGTGYGINALNGDIDISIQYAGQVVPNDEMPSIVGNSQGTVWTGNCAPKDMTLADFAFATTTEDAIVYSTDATLFFINPNQANLKLTAADVGERNPDLIGRDATFSYLSQAEIDENIEACEGDGDQEGAAEWRALSPRWLEFGKAAEEGDYSDSFNDYPVPAGQGFGINALNGDIEIHLDLPGAL